MAVYKRAYAGYDGGHTPRWARFLVLARYSVRDIFASRFFTVMYVLCFMPFLVEATLVYVAHSSTAQLILKLNQQDVLTIDAGFFLTCMAIQAWFGFLAAAWVGPTLVSPDLTNGALPLYLSRPFSRREYVMGKSAVLGGLISVLVWVPVLLLFLLNAALAPGAWLAQKYWIAGSIVASGLLWALFLCLLSLALSAWVRWRVLATLLTFMVFMLPSGFGKIVNVILRTNVGNLLDFFYLAQRVSMWLFAFHDPMEDGTPPAAFGRPTPALVAFITLCVVMSFCLWMLNRRLRAREVVRG
jgi:ABC-2 type transport system permease protein